MTNFINIEYVVKDLNDSLIHWEILPTTSYSQNGTTYTVNYKNDLMNAALIGATEFATGIFKINYYPYIKYAGSNFKVHEISATRTEFRLVPNNNISLQSLVTSFDVKNPPADIYINFGNDRKYQIVNVQYDTDTFDTPPYSIIVKTSIPLDDSIIVSTDSWIVKLLKNTISETVTISADLTVTPDITLLPDFNLSPRKTVSEFPVTVQTYDSLVGESKFSSSIASFYTTESFVVGSTLNIDFYDYSNFVFFGTALSRLNVFVDKLQTLESYNSTMAQLVSTLSASISSSVTTTHIDSIRKDYYDLINQFDLYERFLYSETGSYFTSSLFDGVTLDATPPKTNVYPYKPVTSTTASFNNWYVTQSAIASFYDKQNVNNLVYSIPAKIREDVLNAKYVDFVRMIGHYFDNIYVYVKDIPKIYDRHDDIYTGFAKELIYPIGQSLGLELFNPYNTYDIENTKFGVDSSNLQLYTSGSQNIYALSSEEITQEIWKRLINNIPYIQKTKGTEVALKAILNCYGIPSSILKIKEYGGPVATTNDIDNANTYTYDEFTYALDFANESNAYLTIPWLTDNSSSRKPDSIEFRFALDSGLITSSQPILQSITGSNVGIEIGVTKFSGSLGYVYAKFSGSSTVTSSTYNIFDNRYSAILFERTGSSDLATVNNYVTYIKKYGNSTLEYDFTMSMQMSASVMNNQFVSASSWRFGNTFKGRLDEIRLWNYIVSESAFDMHVRQPSSLVGQSITSSLYDLPLYLSMDIPTNLTASLVNNAYRTDYTSSVSATNFTSSHYPAYFYPIVRQSVSYIPKIGNSSFANNKIRIEVTNDISVLHPDIIMAKSSNDRIAPDNNKLGIFFSPTDYINQTISDRVGNISMDDFIGDPRTEFSSSYATLDTLRNQVMLTTNTYTYYDYLYYVRIFSKAIFDVMKQYIPLKANLATGILVEPTLLSRKKLNFLHGATMETQVIPTVTLSYNEVLSGTTQIYDGTLSNKNLVFVTDTYYSHSTAIQARVDLSYFKDSTRQVLYNTGSLIVGTRGDAKTLTLGTSGSIAFTTNDYNFISNSYDVHNMKFFINQSTGTRRLKYEGCRGTALKNIIVQESEKLKMDSEQAVLTYKVSKNTVLSDNNNKFIVQ